MIGCLHTAVGLNFPPVLVYPAPGVLEDYYYYCCSFSSAPDYCFFFFYAKNTYGSFGKVTPSSASRV